MYHARVKFTRTQRYVSTREMQDLDQRIQLLQQIKYATYDARCRATLGPEDQVEAAHNIETPRDVDNLQALPQAEWKRCCECLQMQPLEMFSAEQWQQREYMTCYACQAPQLHGLPKPPRAGKPMQSSSEQEPKLQALERADMVDTRDADDIETPRRAPPKVTPKAPAKPPRG